ncbi:MAG: hypothetical protein CL508_00060 [Actinobacteria bacterium]|nr:hypothetical protein [Actinomycetota bacterium]|tara:strand:+ start:66 stop:494 length:429 start_codon:yes stop_codon:yes gene_type:complete
MYTHGTNDGETERKEQVMLRNQKYTKNPTIQYIAGLFDGEGCITTSVVKKYNPVMKKRYPCKTIRMEISNTDFGLLRICKKHFKEGHIVNIKPRKRGYLPQQRWQLTHRQVEKVLKKLLPYLHNKAKIKKAREVLKHYEKKN